MLQPRSLFVVLVSAIICRSLYFGAQISDAIIVLSLLAIVAFYELTPKIKKIKEFEDRISSFEAELSKKGKEIDDLRTKIGMAQMSSGMKVSKF